MSRPLIITDCDEVLLHMVVPFREYLDEIHAIDLKMGEFSAPDALRRKMCGSTVDQRETWDLLNAFFASEMHRQTPVLGAIEAMQRLSEWADIVVLTNIDEWAHPLRVEQLASHGLHFPVHWNQGGKGCPLARIVAEYQPSVALFIDDLASHHASVEEHAESVWRLHLVGEPELAPLIPLAERAHARIDHWAVAEEWIARALESGPPRPDHLVIADQA